MQINRELFKDALRQLGHAPELFEGKKLTLKTVQDIYNIQEDTIHEAVEKGSLQAYYDPFDDTVLLDALEVAYLFFCARSYEDLIAKKP